MLSHFSHIQLFVTLWTVACQVHISMGFSRQEYWNGLPALPLKKKKKAMYEFSVAQLEAIQSR